MPETTYLIRNVVEKPRGRRCPGGDLGVLGRLKGVRFLDEHHKLRLQLVPGVPGVPESLSSVSDMH